MTPEREAEIRREFVEKYGPKNCTRNEVGDYVYPSIRDAWAGWLLAHTDSQMARDAERYAEARSRAEYGPWEMADGEPAVVVFIQIPDGVPAHWDAEEVFDTAIDAAIKEQQS